MQIINRNNLTTGEVTKRPSRICKSPYMADVILTNNKELLVHSPSLGCSGLTDSGSFVFMSPVISQGTRSSHRIEFSQITDEWNGVTYNTVVCTNPAIAEHIVNHLLVNDLLNGVKTTGRENKVKGQTTIGDSRFDFTGIDSDGVEFIAEVKAVPSAAPHGPLEKKEKANMMKEGRYYTKHPKEKTAFFPDGYIKPKDVGKKPQSERANKHILELTNIKENSNKRTIMFYVIQRDDVTQFDISKLDPIYRGNVKKAQESGVELYAIYMKWVYDNGVMIGYLIEEKRVVLED